jgi:hypothetical protein
VGGVYANCAADELRVTDRTYGGPSYIITIGSNAPEGKVNVWPVPATGSPANQPLFLLNHTFPVSKSTATPMMSPSTNE